MRKGKFVAPAALALAGLLAACTLREEGVAQRCADMVNAAWPGGVAIATNRVSIDNGTEAADIAGTADGNAIAARCQFEHEVLTDFTWLSGPAAAASGSSTPPPEGGGHQ